MVVGEHTFDVIDDLRRYTGLDAGQVQDLVARRTDSFRAEWLLTPSEHRIDDWFYLSSGTYLFGNAIHDPRPVLETLTRVCGSGGRVLDFGGGSGNLALALAAAGWSVDYLERSALQKDFVAFRVDRYGLGDRLRILNAWDRLPTASTASSVRSTCSSMSRIWRGCPVLRCCRPFEPAARSPRHRRSCGHCRIRCTTSTTGFRCAHERRRVQARGGRPGVPRVA